MKRNMKGNTDIKGALSVGFLVIIILALFIREGNNKVACAEKGGIYKAIHLNYLCISPAGLILP